MFRMHLMKEPDSWHMVIIPAGYGAAIDIRIKTTVKTSLSPPPPSSLQELKQIDAQDLAINASSENTSP